MQFLTTALSLLSLSSAALGCTRYKVQFRSANASCVDNQADFNQACNEIMQTIANFSSANEYVYGSDFTNQFTGCDACGAADPRCYCSVSAWRFHEWQWTDNKYDTGKWDMTSNWTAIDGQTVHC